MTENLEHLKHVLAQARTEAGKVIIGQAEVLDMALIAIVTNQHALVEGVPGVAKTLLVRTLAARARLRFQSHSVHARSDAGRHHGHEHFQPAKNDFTLVHGPVFTTFLLADEINRAPAKTQSALLQAMQERHRHHRSRHATRCPPNFTVFATQNPVEYEGTYPLPEAQNDRFMLKITMAYPDARRGMPSRAAHARSQLAGSDAGRRRGASRCVDAGDAGRAARGAADHHGARRTGCLPRRFRARAPARTRACWSAPARAPRWPAAGQPRVRRASRAAISSRPTICERWRGRSSNID